MENNSTSRIFLGIAIGLLLGGIIYIIPLPEAKVEYKQLIFIIGAGIAVFIYDKTWKTKTK